MSNIKKYQLIVLLFELDMHQTRTFDFGLGSGQGGKSETSRVHTPIVLPRTPLVLPKSLGVYEVSLFPPWFRFGLECSHVQLISKTECEYANRNGFSSLTIIDLQRRK